MNPPSPEPSHERRGCGQTQDRQGQRILLVDDDEDMRSLRADELSDEGYEVIQAANGAEALVLLQREAFAAILLDKRMPGLSGMDLLPGLRVICPQTPQGRRADFSHHRLTFFDPVRVTLKDFTGRQIFFGFERDGIGHVRRKDSVPLPLQVSHQMLVNRFMGAPAGDGAGEIDLHRRDYTGKQ